MPDSFFSSLPKFQFFLLRFSNSTYNGLILSNVGKKLKKISPDNRLIKLIPARYIFTDGKHGRISTEEKERKEGGRNNGAKSRIESVFAICLQRSNIIKNLPYIEPGFSKRRQKIPTQGIARNSGEWAPITKQKNLLFVGFCRSGNRCIGVQCQFPRNCAQYRIRSQMRIGRIPSYFNGMSTIRRSRGTGECTRENSIDRCQDSMGIRTIDNAEHGPSQWGDVEQTCCCFVPRVIGTVPIASRMITRPRFIREIFSIRFD